MRVTSTIIASIAALWAAAILLRPRLYPAVSYRQALAIASSASAPLRLPDGVAVDGSGAVYVSDCDSDRVSKFSPSGRALWSVGRLGGRPGDLNAPMGLAVYDGTLFVANSGNDRVDAFDLNGRFVRTVVAWVPGPSSIAAGPYGLLVAPGLQTNGRYRVRRYDLRDRFLGTVGPVHAQAAVGMAGDGSLVAGMRIGGVPETLVGRAGAAIGEAPAAPWDAPVGVSTAPDGRYVVSDLSRAAYICKRSRVLAAITADQCRVPHRLPGPPMLLGAALGPGSRLWVAVRGGLVRFDPE